MLMMAVYDMALPVPVFIAVIIDCDKAIGTITDFANMKLKDRLSPGHSDSRSRHIA